MFVFGQISLYFSMEIHFKLSIILYHRVGQPRIKFRPIMTDSFIFLKTHLSLLADLKHLSLVARCLDCFQKFGQTQSFVIQELSMSE